MLADTLQILLMVEADLDRPTVLASVLASFQDAVRRKENSCMVRGNLLEIWPNEDADPVMSRSDDDPYLYFRWRVEVTPMDDDLDEDHQIRLARDLRSALESIGARVEVLAAFEDRV